MYATFLAHRVIGGHLEFKNVPKTIKDQVKDVLIEAGAEHLTTETE